MFFIQFIFAILPIPFYMVFRIATGSYDLINFPSNAIHVRVDDFTKFPNLHYVYTDADNSCNFLLKLDKNDYDVRADKNNIDCTIFNAVSKYKIGHVIYNHYDNVTIVIDQISEFITKRYNFTIPNTTRARKLKDLMKQKANIEQQLAQYSV